jgi:uncharacterized membrane protein YphA (DoxX/SURF4 family)
MNAVQSLTSWADAHHPKWLDVLRVLLGVVLFMKGLSFIIDKEMTLQILHDNQFDFISVLLLHYVIIFQMAHSVLIAVGLITRIAIAAQFPIVLGAVVLIATTGSFAPLDSDLWLAVILLFLLVFFFIYGPGPLSVDGALRRRRGTEADADASAAA